MATCAICVFNHVLGGFLCPDGCSFCLILMIVCGYNVGVVDIY